MFQNLSLPIRIVIFLVINFGALALGRMLMGTGPEGEWYGNLMRAPWEPPGWVFGVAWTLIMVCFSIYMAYLVDRHNSKSMMTLFGIQFVLNVIWNYIFFNLHQTSFALIIIAGLLSLMLYFLITYRKEMGALSLFVLPYVIWLIIATSLNAYIVMNN